MHAMHMTLCHAHDFCAAFAHSAQHCIVFAAGGTCSHAAVLLTLLLSCRPSLVLSPGLAAMSFIQKRETPHYRSAFAGNTTAWHVNVQINTDLLCNKTPAKHR